MADNKVELGCGSGSFFMLLGLLFIGLKLGNIIDWSWWLVLLPIYGPTLAIIILIAVIALCIFVAMIIDRYL